MDFNLDINWQRPHHAYFLIGKREDKDFFVTLISKNLDFVALGNPDFSIIETDTFGIDDARSLSNWVLQKPFSGEKKIKVIIANNVTSESQNALLKVLEEPVLGTIIFFIVPNVGTLYKTLLSRVLVVSGLLNEQDDKKSLSEEFLSKTVSERISMIQKLHKSDDKEVMKNLIREIESTFYKKVKNNDLKNKQELLKVVNNSTRFVSSRGASSKMILEQLSCLLPVV